jgi:cytochrome P450
MAEMTAEEAIALFDTLAPGFAEDPYPHYARVREVAPVFHSPWGYWLLSRYDDVVDVLRGPVSVEPWRAGDSPIVQARAVADYADTEQRVSMLQRDAPDHTRLRRLVSQAFTPRAVQRLESRIRALVEASLDDLAQRGTVDLVSDYALPLPLRVISDMLGWPQADMTRLRELITLLTESIEFTLDPDKLRAFAVARDEMRALTAEIVAWKRDHPGDDLITRLLAAEYAGDVLSEQELVEQVILLYSAGHETTSHLISSSALALMDRPDQADLLRRQEDLDANAVEELLRYGGSLHVTVRITIEPYEVHDTVIPPGSLLLVGLAAANRDPDQWGADAEELKLDRVNAREHVAFGSGIHHCLGAALARLEGRIAIPALMRRFPAMAPDGPAQWNGRTTLRGLQSLPVNLTGR